MSGKGVFFIVMQVWVVGYFLRIKAQRHELINTKQQLVALQAERDDLKAALVEARGDTYPKPKKGWQCFHCGEWFTTNDSAKSHFGESPESFTELSNLLEEHRQQYADKCLEVIGLQAENEKLRRG